MSMNFDSGQTSAIITEEQHCVRGCGRVGRVVELIAAISWFNQMLGLKTQAIDHTKMNILSAFTL